MWPSVVHGFDMWEPSTAMTPQLCDRTKSTIQEKDGQLSGMVCDLCCYVGERTFQTSFEAGAPPTT